MLILTKIILSNSDYELKLYEKVIPHILNQNMIYVYADKEAQKILLESNILHLTYDCDEATILIGSAFHDLGGLCEDKPIFATNYKFFKENHMCIGAFYWRKGRPQLKFNDLSMRRFSIDIPRQYRNYIE